MLTSTEKWSAMRNTLQDIYNNKEPVMLSMGGSLYDYTDTTYQVCINKPPFYIKSHPVFHFIKNQYKNLLFKLTVNKTSSYVEIQDILRTLINLIYRFIVNNDKGGIAFNYLDHPLSFSTDKNNTVFQVYDYSNDFTRIKNKYYLNTIEIPGNFIKIALNLSYLFPNKEDYVDFLIEHGSVNHVHEMMALYEGRFLLSRCGSEKDKSIIITARPFHKKNSYHLSNMDLTSSTEYPVNFDLMPEIHMLQKYAQEGLSKYKINIKENYTVSTETEIKYLDNITNKLLSIVNDLGMTVLETPDNYEIMKFKVFIHTFIVNIQVNFNNDGISDMIFSIINRKTKELLFNSAVIPQRTVYKFYLLYLVLKIITKYPAFGKVTY